VENENVATADQVAVTAEATINPAELLESLGQLAAQMEKVNPAGAKQIRAQAVRLEKQMQKVVDVFPAYEEAKLEEALDAFHSEYADSPDTTEFLMVRGSEVRRMKLDRNNCYITSTGIKKILQPARENSGGINPQALSITLNQDGTFTLEPSHAGVDYKDHLANKWK